MMRARTVVVQHFLCCDATCGRERFGADADVVKDMVCTNKVGEKKRGGKKLERPETGQDIPQETVEGAKRIWGTLTLTTRASFRDRGTAL